MNLSQLVDLHKENIQQLHTLHRYNCKKKQLSKESASDLSIIEFDFVPISNKLSFRFIMASEEYDMGFFECNFSDVFAFLLTDENGVTTNLSLIHI